MNYVADFIYVFPSVQGIVDREAAALLPELITLVTFAVYFEQLKIFLNILVYSSDINYSLIHSKLPLAPGTLNTTATNQRY